MGVGLIGIALGIIALFSELYNQNKQNKQWKQKTLKQDAQA